MSFEYMTFRMHECVRIYAYACDLACMRYRSGEINCDLACMRYRSGEINYVHGYIYINTNVCWFL